MVNASSPLFLPTIYFICGTMYVMLAFYLLIRNSSAAPNRFGALIFFCFAVWTSAKMFIHNPYATHALADWAENISALSAFTIGPLILLLSFTLTNQTRLIHNPLLLAAIFLPSLYCIAGQIGFDAVYESIERPFGWGVELKLTPTTILMLSYTFLYTCAAALLCLREALRTKIIIRKKQLILTSACITIGIISGFLSNFIGPVFLSWESPDMAHISALIWLFGLLYAITRYNFLEPSPSNAADTLFLAASDAIIIINSQQKTVAVNPACSRLFGKSEKILQSLSSISLFQDDHVLKKCIEERKEIHDLDNFIQHDDGSMIAVSIGFSIIQSQENDDLGSILIIRDINERRILRKDMEDSQTAALIKANKHLHQQINERIRTEEALKESEANFRALAEQSLLGMIIIKEFKVIYANKAWQKISGYSFEEMTEWSNEGYLHTIHPDDREKIKSNSRKKLDGIHQESTYDWRLICKDGSTKWISMYSKMIQFRGTPAILATLIDTTRQKKMVETIRDSEEKYRILVENAHDVIYIIQDGLIKYANQRLFTTTGYSPDEIYSTHIFEFVHPEDKEIVEQRYRKRVEGADVDKVLNFRIIAKDQKIIWVRNMSVFYTWRDRPAILCFAIDTTAEKDMENMLNHIQRRDAIGSMAGGIAHDLNNILSPILGFSELLQEELPQGSEEREAADQIVSASIRAKALINQILTFSKQKPLKKEMVELHEVINEACKLIKAVIPKRITLEKYIEVLDGCINGDPTQIHQVVMNLLTNGYQSIEDRGHLQISLTRITNCKFDADPHKAYLLLRVKDSGSGIKQENIQRIFDPYFSTKAEGTGIGLSVVMAIVTDLNGYVEVDSPTDDGTTFNLYLPEAVKEQPAGQNFLLQNYATAEKKKILIIDDEKPIVLLFSNVLKRHGYSVAAFHDSFEGVEYFKSQAYEIDLVITDMNMPQLDGQDVTRIVKEVQPACPIILCTGYNENLSAEEAHALGVSDFLQKPASTRELIAMVTGILYQQN